MRAIMGLVGQAQGLGARAWPGNHRDEDAPHRTARPWILPGGTGDLLQPLVRGNLLLPPEFRTPGAVGLREPMPVAEIYEMFPNLLERRKSQGTRMSGGEQQMLAVARILRAGASVLLLDEISEGLAPVIVQKLAKMITILRRRGYTVVMVEQELPLRRAAGRPLLCDGTRRHRRSI
ncbi:ATP-binding cassette domain-containing protein [Cupriavidus basilensis]